MDHKTILNIAAGKLLPLGLFENQRTFIVNVDPMYYFNHEPADVEQKWVTWENRESKIDTVTNIKTDAFEFMERTIIEFDLVCIYRFLEHVSMDKILYFIYLISTVTSKGALVDVIVPDYEVLANMLIKEEYDIEHKNIDFEESNILLTTELLNEPSCPHASIWTEWRAKHFWTLENRFKIKSVTSNYKFDGRDIYLRFIAERL